MGLAISNEHAGNAFYLPAHMLSLCKCRRPTLNQLLIFIPGGYCMRDLCARKHTVQYLEKVEDVIKWKTRLLIETLKKEWHDADEILFVPQYSWRSP